MTPFPNAKGRRAIDPLPVARVAERMGLKQENPRQLECPRPEGVKDGRCPVVVYEDGGTWRCVRCSARGDGLDYAAFPRTRISSDT